MCLTIEKEREKIRKQGEMRVKICTQAKPTSILLCLVTLLGQNKKMPCQRKQLSG